MVHYDEISQVYDQVRQADAGLIRRLLQGIEGNPSARVLDIGCGTGNYAQAIQQGSQAQVVGVDPSAGMLAQARRKAPQVAFHAGYAEDLPLDDEAFDFVYMTDVIHHVAQMDRMFGEIWRVLSPGGKACIVTQSHAQIAMRPIARFFPATMAVDQERYPAIAAIIGAGAKAGLTCYDEEVFDEGETVLDRGFLELVRVKGYSMLHLLGDAEYEEGLERLEAALAQGHLTVRRAGQTLIWFCK